MDKFEYEHYGKRIDFSIKEQMLSGFVKEMAKNDCFEFSKEEREYGSYEFRTLGYVFKRRDLINLLGFLDEIERVLGDDKKHLVSNIRNILTKDETKDSKIK